MFNFSTKISTVADHTLDVFRGIDELKKNEVLVGIPAEKAPRNADEAKGLPINNAAIAYIQTMGMPSKNIPPRPFLEPGIKDAQADIEARFRDAATSALEGRSETVARNLHAAGIVASTAVKLKIQSGPFTPLQPSTLASRRRRGRTGTKPLIDTGQLRNAINYVVRRKP